MNCKHCGGKFTCGCQKSTAKDGSTVHKTCLKAYNNAPASSDKFTQTVAQANQNLRR
jgi:hypothetical protein